MLLICHAVKKAMDFDMGRPKMFRRCGHLEAADTIYIVEQRGECEAGGLIALLK